MAWRKVLIITFVVVLFITTCLVAYFVGVYKKVYVGGDVVATQEPEIIASPTPTPDPLGPKNILLLGYAGGKHQGPTLTDTIIVAHFIPREERVVLISIPRDIWVPLPIDGESEEHFKINHAHAIGLDDNKYPFKKKEFQGLSGGGNLAKTATETVTGLDISNYVSVNFNGFKTIINILGGIEVLVPYTLDDPYYPIEGEEENLCGKSEDDLRALEATMSGEKLEQEFKCRFENLKIEKGLQTLNSDTALKFVRSRHSSLGGGDFGRALRQQAFIKALKDRVLSLKTIPKIIALINTLAVNVTTDINLKEAVELIKLQGKIDGFEIETISLNTDNVLKEDISDSKQFILIPTEGEDQWEEIHNFIEDNL